MSESMLISHDKVQKFYNGMRIEKIFNSYRPDYPIEKYVDVLGYNVGMKNIEEKIISNFDNIKTEIHSKFGLLWQAEKL